MNKYMEEFRKMLVKSQGDLSIHGQVFYIKKNELKKLIIFVKKVCKKLKYMMIYVNKIVNLRR